ncbi:UNVERIFIED_CONTAM: hypothetical protein K2H54_038777 [Gekko kuhli]
MAGPVELRGQRVAGGLAAAVPAVGVSVVAAAADMVEEVEGLADPGLVLEEGKLPGGGALHGQLDLYHLGYHPREDLDGKVMGRLGIMPKLPELRRGSYTLSRLRLPGTDQVVCMESSSCRPQSHSLRQMVTPFPKCMGMNDTPDREIALHPPPLAILGS